MTEFTTPAIEVDEVEARFLPSVQNHVFALQVNDRSSLCSKDLVLFSADRLLSRFLLGIERTALE